jgi:hypothetical protein
MLGELGAAHHPERHIECKRGRAAGHCAERLTRDLATTLRPRTIGYELPSLGAEPVRSDASQCVLMPLAHAYV